MSFVKHAMHAGTVAILGWNRAKFDCDTSDYCHYRSPQKFLESLGIQDELVKEMNWLLLFLVFFRVAAFCIMNYRLKH